MKRIKIFLLLLLSIFYFIPTSLYPQLKKFSKPNIHSEADIYLNSNGTRYSDLITIQFNSKVMSKSISTKNISIGALINTKVKNCLSKLKNTWGNFNMVKVFPNKVWGDTIAINYSVPQKLE